MTGPIVRQAAAVLRMTVSQVHRLIDSKQIGAVKVGSRWQLHADDLCAAALDRQLWVSISEAARIVGCTPPTIARAAHAGLLVQRDRVAAPQLPSLRRDSVHRFHQTRLDLSRQRLAAQADRVPPRAQRELDPAYEWVKGSRAAALLGVSLSRVNQLARSERLPFTAVGRGR